MRRRSRPIVVSLLSSPPRIVRALLLTVTAVAPLALILTSGFVELVSVVVLAIVLGLTAFLTYGRLLKGANSRGYEIIEQDHEWDLARPDGSLAIHRKKLRLRYLNQAMSVVDFAWGDGNLFEEYSCDPGRVVDRFTADGQLWVLISLGGLRQPGQEETLTFQRAISDGFLGMSEWIEADLLEAKRVSLKVVFPQGRSPESVEVVRRGHTLLGRPIERLEALPPSELEEVAERQVLSIESRSSASSRTLKIRWTWPAISVFLSHPRGDAALAEQFASYLRDQSLTVHMTPKDREERLVPGTTSDTAATVLIVGQEPISDRIRSEWSAALESVWDPQPRPVVALLAPAAEMPAPLLPLPAFRLSANRDEWPETFERLRKALWVPERLVLDADIKPDRQRDRKPIRETLEEARQGAERSKAFEHDLVERRRHLEEELSLAEAEGDVEKVRQTAYSLGITLSHLGEPAKAGEMIHHAIELTEREFGSAHPMVADGTYNLALASASMGDTEVAVEMLGRAVELGESALGPEHPKVRVYRSALEQQRASAG